MHKKYATIVKAVEVLLAHKTVNINTASGQKPMVLHKSLSEFIP